MEVSMSVYYLGAVNVIGFLLYGIHLKLFRQRVEGQVDIPLMCLSLAGGSGGIFLSMLFFDRKVQKENVLLKVWNLCLLVIQIMVLLLFKEYQNHGLTFVFWDFFQEHPWLFWYLAGMNVLTFLVFAADKRKAVKKGPRIRIVVLLGLAFLGGSIGALLGMYRLHHKTKKNYFTVGVPLMLVMQVSILLGIMNL